MGASLIPTDAMGPSKCHGTTMNQVLCRAIHCDSWWKFPPKNLVSFFANFTENGIKCESPSHPRII